MRNALTGVACVAALSASVALHAEESAGEGPDQSWKGALELAYLLKRGNTESDTLRGLLDAEKETPDWRHTGKLESSSERSRPTRDDDFETTGERHFGSYKIDRKFGEANYIFNILSAERDRFSGYEYEAAYALGYGRRILQLPAHQLDAEIGPGYRWRRIDDDLLVDEDADKYDNHAVLRLAARYTWQISESAQFREEIISEIDDDGTQSRFVTTLTNKLNSRLSSRITHTLRHNSEVQEGVRKTDQELSVGLVYGF